MASTRQTRDQKGTTTKIQKQPQTLATYLTTPQANRSAPRMSQDDLWFGPDSQPASSQQQRTTSGETEIFDKFKIGVRIHRALRPKAKEGPARDRNHQNQVKILQAARIAQQLTFHIFADISPTTLQKRKSFSPIVTALQHNKIISHLLTIIKALSNLDQGIEELCRIGLMEPLIRDSQSGSEASQRPPQLPISPIGQKVHGGLCAQTGSVLDPRRLAGQLQFMTEPDIPVQKSSHSPGKHKPEGQERYTCNWASGNTGNVRGPRGNICVDNSEYMRNGDFLPTRLQAQQDAVNIVCHSKTRSNPENNVGLITLANNCEVLTTLTPDTGRILSKLHAVQPIGRITFCTGIRVAHLALKHRQGKNHKMRIIAFVGSPVEDNEKDLVKLAKRLKKEKVSVDIINFGEEESNTEKLTAFINTLNGKDGTGSHLVTVPPGPSLADALISSPILAGEGGAMLGLGASDFEFGVDPSADPELALALRVSMEEQRQRQEEEARRATAASAAEAGITSTTGDDSDEALLKMTIGQQEGTRSGLPDFSSMTEDEQIAYAMQMSLQGAEFGPVEAGELDSSAVMDTSEPAKEEDDYDVMQDPEFLQSVLENLPGVDPNNEAIRNAMGSLASQASKDNKKDKKEEKK
ncbi:hypothetical protein XELAEV_18042999mg [Xenopus laevis]|uniref:26S proteasome non-ATPase regulatory subunit 4 n=1 Tax=Xenopus laevis TaxID=8355 RepID=A0A974C575_XENLA|nr:hypothetical protein XELAEV_18042999mg [Xenopus laevis]